MEAFLITVVGYIEFGLNVAAVCIVTIGGAQAIYGVVLVILRRAEPGGAEIGTRRTVWATFARWLVLALEFELAADLLRTIIAPTWADLGQLAVIAAIRTFLSYFLERDIEFATGLSAKGESRAASA